MENRAELATLRLVQLVWQEPQLMGKLQPIQEQVRSDFPDIADEGVDQIAAMRITVPGILTTLELAALERIRQQVESEFPDVDASQLFPNST